MGRSNNLFAFWFDTASAMNAASVTIALRMMRAGDADNPEAFFRDPETRRMADEKWRAAWRGAAAAQTTYWRIWFDLWRRAADGGSEPLWRAPWSTTMWDATVAVARAGSRPGYQKARSNARRLSKRSRR